MTIFRELTSCSKPAAARHPHDLLVMHGGGGVGGGHGGSGGYGGHGGHGGHRGGWGGDGGGGFGGGCGGEFGGGSGGGGWGVRIVFFLVVGYVVLAGLGVFGH